MKLCICNVVPIKNFEEFHSIVAKASQYMVQKKKSEQYIIKCKIDDSDVASAILKFFRISRNVDIHICFSTLLTKCKIVDDTRQKKKTKGNEGNTSELQDPFWIHPTYAGTWEHNYAQKDIISTTEEPLLVLDRRLIIDNNIRHHSQLNSDYISILYIPQLLKKKFIKIHWY